MIINENNSIKNNINKIYYKIYYFKKMLPSKSNEKILINLKRNNINYLKHSQSTGLLLPYNN